jgi:hypothetical protein
LSCGKTLRNSDIQLIANDFPTESKVFRHLGERFVIDATLSTGIECDQSGERSS